MDLDGITASLLGEGTLKTQVDEQTFVDEWGVIMKQTAESLAPYDGPIKTLEDARRFTPPDPKAPHRFDSLRQYVQRFKGKKAIAYLQRADFMQAAYLRRLDRLLVDLIENPILANTVLDIVNEYMVQVAREAIRLGAEVIMLGDDYAYRSGPFMSPKVWKQFIQPRLKRAVDVIHEEGGYAVKHTDGNIWPLIDMIVDTGIDGLNPLEPVAGMDIGEVKRKYGDRVCLVGNIDCGNLLGRGTVDEVVRTVKETIRAAAPDGGYIMMSSNSIHSTVKPENLRAMIETTHRYGVYPLQL
jgi:uroporphyrinogen decarboxylase